MYLLKILVYRRVSWDIINPSHTASLRPNSLAENMSIPAKSKVYLVTYPATLPKEGTIPVEEKIEALTNYPYALKLVGLEEDGLDKDGKEVPGWSIKYIGIMTAEEARQKYSVDDGEPVEIEEGGEWQCYEKGQWATPGRTSSYSEPNRSSTTNVETSSGKDQAYQGLQDPISY